MLGRVAAERGVSVFDLARHPAPLHEALYDYLLLEERERLDGLRRDADALALAVMMNHAINEPKRLKDDLRDYQRRLHHPALARRQGPLTADEKQRAVAIWQAFQTQPRTVS